MIWVVYYIRINKILKKHILYVSLLHQFEIHFFVPHYLHFVFRQRRMKLPHKNVDYFFLSVKAFYIIKGIFYQCVVSEHIFAVGCVFPYFT